MIAETLLHGLFFLVYFGLALYILNKDPGALLNRTVSLLMLVTSLQSLSIMLVRYPTVDALTANISMDILSISMTAFGILAFLSMVIFSGLFRPNLFIYILLSLYLLGFIVFQLKTDFAYVTERNSLGIWEIEFSNPFVLTILDIIHNILLISGFILLFVFIKRTSNYLKRKQIKIILITGLISYSFSFLNIIIPAFSDDVRMLMLNDIFLSVFLIGFIYSIVKYELFEITPSMAAEQLIEMLPSGLIIADNKDNIIRTNLALTNITRRSERFFFGKDLSAVFEDLTNKNAKNKLDEQENFKQIEINTETEKEKTVSVFYKQLKDKFGRFIGSITLIHDIDELIKAQKLLSKTNLFLEKKVEERTHELSLAKEKAEESNRLKTLFIHNLSHEIRTPMNGIIGFSEMLEQDNLSQERKVFFTKMIRESSIQLLKIIDDILEISTLAIKQDNIKEEPFNLNSLFNDIYSTYYAKAKEANLSLNLKKQFDDQQHIIMTDKARLYKILSNLLDNAIKFTHDGYIEMGYYLEQDKVVLYVEDTGIGISENNLEIIFERFSQEDNELSGKHEGLGLGLSISKANAQLLGGDITVESEKGKGSAFFVTLPYKSLDEKQDNLAGNDSKKIKAPKDNITILIAEDEEVNFLYMEALFEEKADINFVLIHALNGQEALDKCMENQQIDIVLMDIKMPVMNGLEATKEIKSKLPNLPIIAQTAYTTESDKQLALKYGCDDFISKPIEKEKLIEMINKYLIDK